MPVKIIEINGIIDIFMQERMEFALQNIDPDVTKLHVNIASRGGDYIVALSIFNALRETRKHIVTAAQGFVGSAGAFLLLAGDTIEAAENAVITFHLPELLPGSPINADEMEKMITNLRVVEDSLIASLSTRTGKPKEEIQDFLRQDIFLTPTKAKEMNLIDKILPFKRRKINVSNITKDATNVPDEVLNFVQQQNEEIELMSLKELCSVFSIDIKDDADDAQITAALTTHFNGLQERVTALEKAEKDPPKDPPKVPPSSPPSSPVKLPVALLNMVKRGRQTEIDSLVQSGKITNAVATDLKTLFINDERISAAVDSEGQILDSFDATIDALKKNESVLNLSRSSLSGLQQLPKDSPEENYLLKDAEARASAASSR